ncbi:MAG: glycosyltransferase [Gammaproteobacteria bacterium]|nr:glycosyltransferase [Gammaproteobacteria bacterium]
MTKKQHVCIDGLNLSLSKGTGIATYARNLGDYLQKTGYSLSILFDKKINDKFPDVLYEAVFYDALNKASEKERRPRESMVHYFLIPFYFIKSLLYFIRPPKIKQRSFSGVVENEDMKNKLPTFNTVYNSGSLYRLAQCYFMLFRRLLPIKLSPTPDIMHWTCPIPIRVVGAKNYYTIHDLIPLRLPYTTQDNKKFFYDLIQKIVHSADKLVTVSEFSRHDIINYLSLPEEKVINAYQSISLHSRSSPDDKTFFRKSITGSIWLITKKLFSICWRN